MGNLFPLDVCIDLCNNRLVTAVSEETKDKVCKVTFVPDASCGPEGCSPTGCCERTLEDAQSGGAQFNGVSTCFDTDEATCEAVYGEFLPDGTCNATTGHCVPGRETPGTGECDDGEDNDVDGAVDCEDTDCFGAPECVAPAPALSRWGIAATILLLAAVAFVGLRRRQVRLLFLSMFWGVASKV